MAPVQVDLKTFETISTKLLKVFEWEYKKLPYRAPTPKVLSNFVDRLQIALFSD